MVTLIIPVYNNARFTQQCLASIFKYKDENPKFTTLVVDDGSDSKTKDLLKEYPLKVLTNTKNRGYLYSTNKGIKYALNTLKSKNIVLMNNDVEVRRGWLEKLSKYKTKYDLIGYHGRMSMGESQHKKACFLEFSTVFIKSKVFKKIGLLDKRFVSGYYSDDDFCLRAMLAGFRIGQIAPGKPSLVMHRGHRTYTLAKTKKHVKREYKPFLKKWGKDDSKLVQDYLKKYTYDPYRKGWGEMSG